jgi:polyisoprenoid-binding protein YceI
MSGSRAGTVEVMSTDTRRQSPPALDALGRAPTGAWVIDPAHSSVTFSVRHLMSRVRGRFGELEGRIEVGPSLDRCSATASVAAASVDTGTAMRDDDLRSERFFDAETYPTLAFTSTAVTGSAGKLRVVGELTIREVTREVSLDAEFLGLDETGLQGEARIGFSGRVRLRRSDFGVGAAAEGGKVVIGDLVDVEIDLEAALEAALEEGPAS